MTNNKINEILRTSDHIVYDIFRDFLDIRREIEEAHPEADFLNGQCMLFHIELKRRFPKAECLFNNDHVVTLINGSLWDYEGVVYLSPQDEPNMYQRYIDNTERFLNAN